MDWTKFLGLFAGFCTTISVTPQLYKTWKEKSVEDISLKMFSVLTFGLILWVTYGVLKSDIPVIVTNSVATFLNIVMLIFYFKYRD